MLNTYGLRSINSHTFNVNVGHCFTYPKDARDVLVTALRVHNLAFNVLGYIPGVSLFSGAIRAFIGGGLLLATALLGNPHAQQGIIIGHYYREAIRTGLTQIFRGVMESMGFRGLNLVLDGISTPLNVSKEMYCRECLEYGGGAPYKDPDYPLLLSPLYLV